jgi:hypothetical protein
MTAPGEGHVPDIGQPKFAERIAAFAEAIDAGAREGRQCPN